MPDQLLVVPACSEFNVNGGVAVAEGSSSPVSCPAKDEVIIDIIAAAYGRVDKDCVSTNSAR